jgi:carbon monoxide dehydrogenase subunit G
LKLLSVYAVPAPQERVYAALIDPAILQKCIPGCEALTLAGEDRYEARVKIGIAGLKGTYTGHAELLDKQPPIGFTLAVGGKGAPGFVRSTAKITLATLEGTTRIICDADVEVGGLLAAVGSRLVEAAARTQMDDFFRRVGRELAGPAPETSA